MKTKYFKIDEIDNTHVGIAVASTNEELRMKIIQALENHLDCEVVKLSEVSIEDCIMGGIGEYKATIDTDGDCSEVNIYVEETWLF